MPLAFYALAKNVPVPSMAIDALSLTTAKWSLNKVCIGLNFNQSICRQAWLNSGGSGEVLEIGPQRRILWRRGHHPHLSPHVPFQNAWKPEGPQLQQLSSNFHKETTQQLLVDVSIDVIQPRKGDTVTKHVTSSVIGRLRKFQHFFGYLIMERPCCSERAQLFEILSLQLIAWFSARTSFFALWYKGGSDSRRLSYKYIALIT